MIDVEISKQRPNTEVWQLLANIFLLQGKKRSHRAWPPPPTLPELTSSKYCHCEQLALGGGGREETVAVWLKSRISTALRTGEKVSELQMHSVTNSSDKGRNIQVRQLWYESHHYMKENKVTNKPTTSLRPPQPQVSVLMTAEAPRATEAYSSAYGCSGNTRISKAQNPIKDPNHPQGCSPETKEIWLERMNPHHQEISHHSRSHNSAIENIILQCYLLEWHLNINLLQNFLP